MAQLPVLAVDLGGTKIEAALVSPDGTVADGSRSRRETGPQSTPASLTAAVRGVVHDALASLAAGASLRGVGVGSAGPVDLDAGTVAPLNLAGAKDFPLVAAVSAAVSEFTGATPAVHLALDGLCIALAEHRFGAASGVGSTLGMVVSTGIGGGIVSRGIPVRGGTGNAGHIGQIEVAGFAGAAHGLDATVERIASGPNIVRWAREQGWTGRTGEELGADYAAGDALAVAAVRRSAGAVGAAVASACALTDVDMVVIGGGFSHVSPDYLDLVREARDRYAAFPFMARARIERAGLGSDAPLVGAAALALDAGA